jgi:hypothetical protein
MIACGLAARRRCFGSQAPATKRRSAVQPIHAIVGNRTRFIGLVSLSDQP